MTVADKGIPSWPKVTIRLYDDHNAEVKIAGRSHPVNHHDPRQAALALVAERAGQLGRPVKATAVEADGSSWPLVIHPDGQVDAIEVAAKRKPIWPILVAAGLAIVLVGGTTAYLLLGREPATPKPPAVNKLPELPAPRIVPDQFIARPAPPGWAASASWTLDIAEGSAPAVSTDGSEVAVLTEDQKLVVLDSGGKVLWQDEVPKNAGDPVYTTIDSQQVLAVATPKKLLYWPGDGFERTEIELPDGADVQFFGSSPLVTFGDDGASVVSNGALQTVQNQPRFSTVLLAEGDKALIARYAGPLYWSQPGKELQERALKPPAGATSVNHIAMASPGRAMVIWNTKNPSEVIPTVNSTADGSVAATCPKVDLLRVQNWKWVPDQTGKVAAYGECVIDFIGRKTSLIQDFDPLSVTGTTIYANVAGSLSSIVPGGGKLTALPANAARPWGVAGNRAIVVHDTVLYALDKK
ncbi:hypothetical protein Kfla_6996 [Kribbella flavida DSM 17836]|uniref:Uncharacterized protein n=1 Tax=Kribbella flavida (strain DSM 17836 / JCM 10339 / NBRC 14399) TaxID=479435 RepID=D2Q3W2_KRIFD|nr:hypothetical protein [Kribbella flavida]ADB35984.1 hypothetical protein Kfla_6996 [Kribbella flavida DSM 17836]